MGGSSATSSAQATALKVSLVVSESKVDARPYPFYSGWNASLLQMKSPSFRAEKTLRLCVLSLAQQLLRDIDDPAAMAHRPPTQPAIGIRFRKPTLAD